YTYLFGIPFGEVAQVFAFLQDFVIEKICKTVEKLIYICFVPAAQFANKVKILFRSQIPYQKRFINKSRSKRFPLLTFTYFNSVIENMTRRGLNQVEQ